VKTRPHWAGELLVVAFLLVIYDQVAGLAKLRAEGATWQAIGHALGVTRSAAQQKYGEPAQSVPVLKMYEIPGWDDLDQD